MLRRLLIYSSIHPSIRCQVYENYWYPWLMLRSIRFAAGTERVLTQKRHHISPSSCYVSDSAPIIRFWWKLLQCMFLHLLAYGVLWLGYRWPWCGIYYFSIKMGPFRTLWNFMTLPIYTQNIYHLRIGLWRFLTWCSRVPMRKEWIFWY